MEVTTAAIIRFAADLLDATVLAGRSGVAAHVVERAPQVGLSDFGFARRWCLGAWLWDLQGGYRATTSAAAPDCGPGCGSSARAGDPARCHPRGAFRRAVRGRANPSQPEEKPTAEEKSAEKGKGGRSEKGHRKGGEQASSRSGADTKKGAETSASNPAHAPESASTAKPTGKKGGKSIDDMLGEVGNKKSGGDDASKPKPAAVNLISLTQSDIVNAMRAVQPRIQACANQFKVPGTAMASISVAAGGKVTSSTVTGKFAGTPTGTCVEAAAKSAKFPPCNSMSFPWPFTLSPR